MFLKATVIGEEIVVKWFNVATQEATRYVVTGEGLELPDAAAKYGLEQYGDRLTKVARRRTGDSTDGS